MSQPSDCQSIESKFEFSQESYDSSFVDSDSGWCDSDREWTPEDETDISVTQSIGLEYQEKEQTQ